MKRWIVLLSLALMGGCSLLPSPVPPPHPSGGAGGSAEGGAGVLLSAGTGVLTGCQTLCLRCPAGPSCVVTCERVLVNRWGTLESLSCGGSR